MDDRAARRLGAVRADSHTSSGIVTAVTPEGNMSSTAIAPGTLIEGKYSIGRVIGTGAVGVVYEARNVELDETVALKCLKPEVLSDEVMVARFAREAKAAAAIKSEYVATVHDVGSSPSCGAYIVMEYLDGQDFGHLLGDTGPLNARAAVEYALQVCEALAVAHSKGIVHRDIKPENLLLTDRQGGMQIVKVLDFGISKAALTGSIFQQEMPLVKTVNLMGTPLYMSPEQIRATDSVDIRSDIWSLGMVLYETLAGQTAFTGQSITEICAAILEHQPTPLEQFRNDLPPGLSDVILRCLRKDANERYQNVAELALALMPFGPKRSRLNVERAVAVLKGSGLLHADVRVHSTYPPPSPASQSDLPPIPFPRPANVPSLASTMPAGPASSRRRVEAQYDTQQTVATLDMPRKGSSRVAVASAVVVLLVGLGGIAYLATRGPTPHPAATAAPRTEDRRPPPPQAVAPPPPAPAPVPPVVASTGSSGSASPSTSATSTSSPTTAKVSTSAHVAAPSWKATTVRPAPAAPAHGAKVTPPTPAAPPPTPAAAKPKGPEEPDLGY